MATGSIMTHAEAKHPKHHKHPAFIVLVIPFMYVHNFQQYTFQFHLIY
jgi:hypothetical protein